MSIKKMVTFLAACGLVYITYKGFLVNGVKSVNEAFTNEGALEKVYYIVQIIVGITMVIGALVAVWQYVLTARSERLKIDNDRVEKAVKLSEYYKDYVLNRIVVLRYVFEESGIKSILDNIKPSDMIEFDVLELKEVLSKVEIDKIQKIINSKKLIKAIEKANEIYELGFCLPEFTKELEEGDSNFSRISNKLMSRVVNDLLNNMEYFAMHFTHKVADESVVYQSLHQTYVEVVQLSYYNIAINNKADGKQYYTNVIELYRIWYNKQQANRLKTTKNGRIVSKGNSVKQ